MAIWTTLLITAISGPLDRHIVAGGIYPTHAAFIAAFKPIGATVDVDYQSECIATCAPIVSPRTKERVAQ